MFGLFKKDKAVTLTSPLTGKVLDLSKVPDEVFSNKMVGDGVAIEPTDGVLVSPVKGTIKQIFPTKHAVGIETDEGVEILMHIGINTVELSGEGFEKLAEVGSKVKVGDKLIKFDLDYIEENATSIITPILITNMDDIKGIDRLSDGEVKLGENELLKVKL
ncbi:PTS sugar transporter subunit IIA [Orenia marismortui]|uniref:PTS system glucose-specific IIA component n=1 Tax=Orenia marismortui TaxID=46469 RepID=A0A4R8H3W5_9FIRM|nr:PTS glucose transporter subunit IIA [Orenia marismortui]TDX51378.1 PTS system glucose-specific IIA component [Orenia marismortui]